jgi:hypothetical protein
MRFRSTLTPMSVLLIVALSACGGGGGGDGVATLGADKDGDGTTDTTLSEEEAEAAMVDWTACMREAGVDLPDVQADGNGNVRIGAVGGAPDGAEDEGDETGDEPAADMPSKEDFDAAVKECGDPPRLGGELSEEDRKEMQDQALAFAECMRDEGIDDFPDPDFSKMGPGAGPNVRIDERDAGDADEEGDTKGPFGDIDVSSPEFQAAQATCSAKNPGGPQFRTNGKGDVSVSANATKAS